MVRTTRLLIAGRVLAGLTQHELAVEAGVAPSALQAIEQGKSDPKLSTLLAITDALSRHGVRVMGEDGESIGSLVLLRRSAPKE